MTGFNSIIKGKENEQNLEPVPKISTKYESI